MDHYTEDSLVEQPAIGIFESLGWHAQNCYHETFGSAGTLGRADRTEVVLTVRLRHAIARLNPGIPTEAVEQAVEELVRDRSAMTPVNANREVYKLLKGGVKATYREGDDGDETTVNVRVIDWDKPANNDYFLASQFWVFGGVYTRRADLVGFVNGIPLIFIELKAWHKHLKLAFDQNFKDYRTAIPQLFWGNALVILSNGSDARIGTLTSEWEHFADWKRINSEGEKGIVGLDTLIRGTCDPVRLLDLVENFTLFSDMRGGTVKLVGKNHQYLGVNNAIQGVRSIKANQGRLGVFWHTQGSGKSFSMVFFAQKVLRKLPGNWTFVVVTDRQELDDQIYKTFASCGAATEKQVQADSAENLRELLREDHRYVFTLIQKFRTERGQKHPKLSDRSDIIVITDEAHRSQYDTFALNMRNALPNAAFIGFTGTPLMAGEEKTKAVFGDYVSIYNFRQSIEDGATVPLYYENRIPELQLTNQDLNDDLAQVIEDADLDESQEAAVEREFAREYHLITRDDRLETIAQDIVTHFVGRGFKGKGMVVCIDKMTAVRMYDKVKVHWAKHLSNLKSRLEVSDAADRPDLEATIKFMETTDMAVVVSQAQNEVDTFKSKGLDILPHRKRMISEDLETKFKDPDEPLRLVFVCAMWMTGFDVPSCSTIYLDKPMKNHGLMQTIARANRVWGAKVNGLIVDYVGVFRNLQKALAIYGTASGGGVNQGESPVQDKSAQVEELRTVVDEAIAFCKACGADPATILPKAGLLLASALDEAVEAILTSEESKKKFLTLAGDVNRLFRAILPDAAANEFAAHRILFLRLAQKIRSLDPPVEIDKVMNDVERVLDESIAAEGYVIQVREPVSRAGYGPHLVDLSKIDFDALKALFSQGLKRTQAEKLKGAVRRKLQKMVQVNKTRTNYLDKFQKLIDEYNAGSQNIDEFFKNLLKLSKELNEEDRRAVAESLSEEELAVFDILTKPDPTLAPKDEKAVKKVARSLLEKLKAEKLVLDWRKRQQTRAAVRQCIEELLDEGLPRTYTPELFEQKSERVYQHVFEAYYGQGRSIYTAA